jgi:diadenylate cyclase
LDTVSSFFETLFGAFLSMGIADVLDIIFVTVVLYKLIGFVRDTRALALLRGVIVLAVVYIAVELIGMEVMRYLMSIVLQWGVIVFVVLFAPEIRSGLERMGRGGSNKGLLSFFGFGSSSNSQITEDAINSVCKACAELSDSKIGALIVFERTSLLSEEKKSGTKIDAEVETDLLKTIFFPKTPLHDGAVIISGGKISFASCILPSTKDTHVSRELGTRHRAALGVTENSDAVVAVVSEETGAISFCGGGVLKRGLSDGDLRLLLTGALIKTETGKKRSRVSRFFRG